MRRIYSLGRKHCKEQKFKQVLCLDSDVMLDLKLGILIISVVYYPWLESLGMDHKNERKLESRALGYCTNVLVTLYTVNNNNLSKLDTQRY